MRSLPALILLVFGSVPAPALAQSSCAGVFGASRDGYLIELRRAADDRNQIRHRDLTDPAQRRADLSRRIVKHLFIETNLFLNPTNEHLEVPKITPASLVSHVTHMLAAIEKTYGFEHFRPHDIDIGAIAAFAKKLNLSAGQARDVLQTLDSVAQSPSAAAELLQDILMPSATALDRARYHEGQRETTEQQIQQKRRTLTSTRGYGVLGAFVSASVPLIGGMAFPGLPAESTIYAAFPALMAGMFFGDRLGTTIFPIKSARAKYHRARAGRAAKGAMTDIRKLHREIESVHIKENADTAFDLAWDGWLASAQMAEASRGRPQTETLTDRISQFTLLIEATGHWQAPNGERFADLLRDRTLLTPARVISLRAGLELKASQLDLMLKELGWIERDLERLAAEGPRPESMTVGEDLRSAYAQMIEGLRVNVRALRQLTEDRQDELTFAEDQLNAGEEAFRQFVETRKSKG